MCIMADWHTFRTKFLIVFCLIAQLAAEYPLFAMSKIIVVPTARTIGAGNYQVDLTHKEPLLDASTLTLDFSAKVGLGERCQMETKVQMSGGNNQVLWYGKYTFAVEHGGLTTAAIGIENVSPGSQATPYIVSSHLFKPVDLSAGIAMGVNAAVRYFTGADYQISKKLHILGDYNTGNTTYASMGFQYEFSHIWSMKSGLEANRGAASDVMIKIAYSNNY